MKQQLEQRLIALLADKAQIDERIVAVRNQLMGMQMLEAATATQTDDQVDPQPPQE